MQRFKTACFSGYRPEKFPFPFQAGSAPYEQLKKDLKQAVAKAVLLGVDAFYCGMAQGFDLLCAETVLALKKEGRPLRLFAALPFAEQAAGWPTQKRALYHALLRQCDGKKTFGEAGGYQKGCYHIRNRYMIENSDLLICYYDGRPGGTAFTVSLAQKENLTVWNLAEEKATPQQLSFEITE